jgi:hypothetical protein
MLSDGTTQALAIISQKVYKSMVSFLYIPSKVKNGVEKIQKYSVLELSGKPQIKSVQERK